MYARPFIHNNQIILLTDPINREFVYQFFINVGVLCWRVLNIVYNVLYTICYHFPFENIMTYIPSIWLGIGFIIIYNIYLFHLRNQLKAVEDDILNIKINITRITNLFANRDDYLDDYIKATDNEFLHIKKEIYKYKTE